LINYDTEVNRQGIKVYGANLISNRGTWIKFDIDKEDFVSVKIDKTKKFSAYLFLRALGLEDQEIYENIENSEYFRLTSQFDESLSREDCLLKVHSYLRPEESPTVKGCQQLLYSKFFDPKRYDLGFIGRYKINRRFNLKIDENIHILTSIDVAQIVNYLINFRNISIQSDDIDHLGNRRIRSIGELLVNQVRIGLNRLERIIHERMSICDPNYLRVNILVNP
jgi:DNA-directed RNA polymerase subunit beta